MDKKSIKVGIIEIWTILAIVLHFCDVGYFAKWPVIDWPWHWSCCCLLIWEWIVVIVLLLVFSIIAILLRTAYAQVDSRKNRRTGW